MERAGDWKYFLEIFLRNIKKAAFSLENCPFSHIISYQPKIYPYLPDQYLFEFLITYFLVHRHLILK